MQEHQHLDHLVRLLLRWLQDLEALGEQFEIVFGDFPHELGADGLESDGPELVGGREEAIFGEEVVSFSVLGV